MKDNRISEITLLLSYSLTFLLSYLLTLLLSYSLTHLHASRLSWLNVPIDLHALMRPGPIPSWAFLFLTGQTILNHSDPWLQYDLCLPV